jgi:hypothetical protein
MAEENDDNGVSAINTIIGALKPLDEKTRNNVLEFVLKQLGIDMSAKRAPSPEQRLTAQALFDAPASTSPLSDQMDIRTLGEEKRPKTVNEKVALVAYYLRNVAPTGERRDYIIASDIARYFVEAGFALPTGPANMTLTNAKNAGYLNSAGSGQYRLNAVGHNLVAHRLPSGDAPKPKKKKGSTKKSR